MSLTEIHISFQQSSQNPNSYKKSYQKDLIISRPIFIIYYDWIFDSGAQIL